MNTYTVHLKGKRQVADQTMAYSFEKPEGFQFQAGQYVAITLPELDFQDKKGTTRCMSLASAPSDSEIVFAMRVTDSAFKQTLANMPEGGEIVIRDAVGRFTLPEDESRTIVFLAGGIGITPARSILREANQSGRKNPFWLFYSNRTAKDIAFADELDVNEFPNLSEYHCINTLTDEGDEMHPKQDECGFIDAEMLKKHLSDVATPLYYVVGTPGFAQAMTKMLTEELGISQEAIRQDPFTGM